MNINIFPNSGIYTKKKNIYVLSSIHSFYNKLSIDIDSTVKIYASQLEYDPKHNLKEIKKPNLYFINIQKYSSNKFFQILKYIITLFTIPLYIIFEKNTFNYIFIPGNIPIITTMWLILFNKDFGLYIRGDISNRGKLLSKLYLFIIRKAKFCIVTGEVLKNEIEKINNRTEAVSPMLKYTVNDINIKTYFNNKIETQNLLYVGRFTFEKGIYELLSAFDKVYKNQPNIRLTIIGQVPKNEEDRFETFIKKNDFKNLIIKNGISNKNILKQEFINSDIFILPSHHEGFPRVLYEAMIFGVPIITSDLPGIKIEMIEGENCLKFPIGNINVLSKKIEQLINEKDLQTKFSMNGNKFMNNLFYSKPITHSQQLINNIKK